MRYVRGAMKKKLGGGYKWHLSVHFSSHYLDSAYPSLLITSKGGGTSIHGLCIAAHPSLVAFLCTDRPTLIGLSTLLKQAKIASLYKRYMRIQGLLKTGPANQWRILGGGGGFRFISLNSAAEVAFLSQQGLGGIGGGGWGEERIGSSTRFNLYVCWLLWCA